MKVAVTFSNGLREHVAANRREILATLLRSSGGPAVSGSLDRHHFATAFLDRLTDEIATGNCTELDAWATGLQTSTDGHDEPGVMLLMGCAAVSASYSREHQQPEAVIRYLALRGAQLQRLVEAARSARLPDFARAVDRDEVIGALLATLEARDGVSCAHSRAVGSWCERLAGELGLAKRERTFVAISGMLHDIGKVTTPAEVLLKPGPLTEDEWVVMRAHSVAGAQILAQIPSLQEFAPIVRAHHERIDGDGYPDSKSGDGIPLAARIVAVADAFHAMVAKRPYRDPLSAPRALTILAEGRGTQWETSVVNAFTRILAPQGVPVARPALVAVPDR